MSYAFVENLSLLTPEQMFEASSWNDFARSFWTYCDVIGHKETPDAQLAGERLIVFPSCHQHEDSPLVRWDMQIVGEESGHLYACISTEAGDHIKDKPVDFLAYTLTLALNGLAQASKDEVRAWKSLKQLSHVS